VRGAAATVKCIRQDSAEKGLFLASKWRTIKGELLSVDKVRLCIQSQEVVCIPTIDVVSLELEIFAAHGGAAGAIVGIGLPSTLTHGFFLILSAPVWLAIGIPVAVAEGDSNDLRVKSDNFGAAFQYARYPQGLPPYMLPESERTSPDSTGGFRNLEPLEDEPVAEPIEDEPVAEPPRMDPDGNLVWPSDDKQEDKVERKPSVIGELPEP
jgi:hypothetical protein